MDSDFELVQRWSTGDRFAGDLVIRRHFPALRRFFVTRVAHPEERDDLIQDTLHALIQAAASFEHRSSFRSFLFGIARHKLYAYLQRNHRDGQGFDPINDSFEDLLARSPSSLAALRESSQQLIRCMTSLSIGDQLLLELRYWQGLSGPELAEIFGVSSESVRARLLRARRRLAVMVRESTPREDDADQMIQQRLRAIGDEL